MSQQLPLRVLLADDETNFREPLAKHLRHTHGYEVDTAADGQEVLNRLKQMRGRYDVALIDDLLVPAPGGQPKSLGIDLIKAIKAPYPNIEIIIFTGWGMQSGLEALRAGAYRYLAKPFNLEELGMLIQTAAEHSHLKNVTREKQILEQLMKTSTALLNEQNLPEVLDTILQGVHAIGFDRVGLYLLTEDREMMVGQAQVGIGTEFVGHERPVAKDIHMQILLTDPRPQVFEREDDKPLPYERVLDREGVKQWACVPLVRQKEVIGKLTIDNKISQQLIMEAELESVALFAAQAAAAIEQTRLRDKERKANQKAAQRTHQLEVLHQIDGHINSALNLEGILQVTLDKGLRAIRTREGSIMLMNPTTNELEIKAWIVQGEFKIGKSHRKLALGEGIAGYVAMTGQVYNCSDVSNDTHFVGSFTERSFHSLLSVPIASRGRVLGTINADSKEHDFFKEDDVQFLLALADQVATAIETQRLRNIGMELSTLTVDEMLMKIVESACVLIGTEFGDIFLTHKETGDVVRAARFPASRETTDEPRKEGGLTAHIINHGEPVVIANAQGDPRVRQSTKKRRIASLMGVPLRVRVEHQDLPEVRTIGVLYVDAMQKREFSNRDVELLQSLANQAAIAIEKTRLYEEVVQERDRSESMASQLLTLAEIMKEIQAELDLPSLLNLISQKATKLLRADAGGILLLDNEKKHLTFKGSCGLGQQIVDGTRDVIGGSIAGRVVEKGHAIIANDIPNDTRFYNPAADGEGLLAIMSTPLQVSGEIIGTLDVHSKSNRQAFNEDDLQLLSLMASQAAIAIQNAALFEKTNRHAHALETLHKTSLEITSCRQVPELVRSILERAVELLQAKGGGLYQLDEANQRIMVAAVSNLSEHFVGTSLGVEEGVIGQIIKTRMPLSISDYRHWPHRLRQYDMYGFTAVAGVPISWEDKIWGILAVHDDLKGRTFSQEDLNLLSHFGNLAAVALESAELAAKDAHKLRRLEKLSQANSEIMENLGTMPLDERLSLIARHATEILDAEACGIFLVKRPGFLSLEASYGHQEESFKKGREYIIHSGPQTGLTGHVAHEGKLFNAYGDDLVNHFAVKGEPNHAASGLCYSLLIIPLKKKSGYEEKLIGLLRVDNKKNRNGQADPMVGFTQEDEWILRLFADAAIVAIEGAELVAQLNEQKDQWARLVASSPNGIIAIDHYGNVTDFNEQAQKILKYQFEEVLGKSVDFLYDNPREPRRVGALLHAALHDKLANHETFIRSKVGERIPIRLAATWLYDVQGNRIGSVGYFEDLRSIKAVEQRLDLLLKASNTVAQAENLNDSLQSLAEMIVTFLNVSFCRCFLFDESHQILLAKAAYPTPFQRDQLDWDSGPEEQIILAQWPLLAEVLVEWNPKVLRIDHKQHRSFLIERSRRLGLKQNIQSLFLVPLKARNKVVGLLALAELRPWAQAPFSKQKQEMAVAIADQVAMLIDRILLLEITERHRQLLLALVRASRHIRAEKETFKLLQEVVRLAAELVGCTAGGLYLNHPQLKELELYATYELPPQLIGSRLPHTEGLVGLVARTDQPQVVYDYSDWPDRENILEAYHLKTVVGIPLKQAGETEAVLFVADQTGLRQFAQIDLEILESFAVQASIALQTSQLLSEEQRKFRPLAILHKVSDYIQAARDLDKIVHVVLTGITAGYGLGFNRAVLLLLDKQRENLIGCLGIGHLDEVATWEDWAIHNNLGREDFKQYLELLEQDALPLTPIGERIRGLKIPLRVAEPNLFSQIALAGQYTLVTEEEFDKLPGNFIEAFEPTLPLIVIPLLAGDHVIGLLVADNKFTRSSIMPEDIDSLLTFANTAALAIYNTQLLHETEVARERLRSFYEASNALISSRDPELVLEDIVEQTRVAADAVSVSVCLIDEMGTRRNLMTVGTHKQFDVNIIRPNGISMQVMNTSKAEIIEDTNKQRDRVNPVVFQYNILAALCLPFSFQGTPIGVMWIHYDQPRHFPMSDIEAIQLYVNQAAITYDSARRIKELEYMRQAAEALAGVVELQEILRQIVYNACKVLQADSAAILSYDTIRDRFIHQNSVAIGMPVGVWEQFLKERPRRRQTAYTVMERGWIGVEDVNADEQYTFMGKSTRKLLRQIGARSFQGVALSVGEEKLAVLYVNYNRPRSFNEEIREAARTFANHAALAFKNAKLLDQVRRTQDAARIVAEVTALGALQGTLDSIVKRTRDVLGCDVVTLYSYDPDRKDFDFPPAMIGVKYPEKMLEFGKVSQQSVLYKILTVNNLYIAENARMDPLAHTSFVDREGLMSSVGIPLMARDYRVGVMFVNYRNQHRFTTDELTNIKLFANQAAVAIRNAQLYEQVQKRARALQALYEAGQIVTSSLNLDEILASIAEQAWRLTGASRASHLARIDRNKLTFIATYPPEQLSELQQTIGDIDLERDELIGITGLTVKTSQSQLVSNVTLNPNYIKYDPETCSELAVLLKAGEQIIGVINVEHSKYDAFDHEDQRALESLAAQAAIAIQNARLYRRVRQRAEQFQTLYQASLNLTAELSVEAVLQGVTHHARQLTRAQYGALGVLNAEGKINPFITSGPVLVEQTQIGLPEGHGVLGLLLREPKPIRVRDIRQHPSFIGFPSHHPEMISFLGVPIFSRGTFIGNLYMTNKLGALEFSQEDQDVLELLATQAAIAIENARLFEQTKKAAERLTAIHRISLATTSPQKLQEEILQVAIQEMVNVFEVNQGAIVLFNRETDYGHTAVEYPETRDPQVLIPLKDNGSMDWILTNRRPLAVEDASHDPRLAHMWEALECWGVKSMLLVPLIVTGEVMGTVGLDVTERPRWFSTEEQDLAQTMANHVASAIANARLYEGMRRRLQEQTLLHEVALAASSVLRLDEVLQAVANRIAEALGYESVGIHLVDEMTRELTGPMYYAGLWPRELNTSKERGITGRVVRSGHSALVPDVSRDHDYVAGTSDTQAEICVPLRVNNKVVGIINIESTRLYAFTDHDLRLIETIAGQVAMAIDRARQYEELKQTYEALKHTKGLVGTMTAVSWMGTVAGAWRHSVGNNVTIIEDLVKLIRTDLKGGILSNKIEARLVDIEETTSEIQRIPMPPLSTEDGVESVFINQLINERIGQSRKKKGRYEAIDFKVSFFTDDTTSVRASPEWLHRVIDIVIDNAILAMDSTPIKQLTVTTRLINNGIEIAITDTGMGIPARVLAELFEKPIKKQKGEKGSGLGLFLARTIVQTYGGILKIGTTDASGTTVIIWLPLEL